jgi:hypothetical protein
MILVLEQDIRRHPENGNRRWVWKPLIFRNKMFGKRTWRIGWGLWTLSYYGAPGLKDFLDYIRQGNTEWKEE